MDDDSPSIAERARTLLAGHLPGQLQPAARRHPLTVSGRLTIVETAGQRVAATEFADVNPHPDLFDVGRGRSIWRMDVGTSGCSVTAATATPRRWRGTASCAARDT